MMIYRCTSILLVTATVFTGRPRVHTLRKSIFLAWTSPTRTTFRSGTTGERRWPNCTSVVNVGRWWKSTSYSTGFAYKEGAGGQKRVKLFNFPVSSTFRFFSCKEPTLVGMCLQDLLFRHGNLTEELRQVGRLPTQRCTVTGACTYQRLQSDNGICRYDTTVLSRMRVLFMDVISAILTRPVPSKYQNH